MIRTASVLTGGLGVGMGLLIMVGAFSLGAGAGAEAMTNESITYATLDERFSDAKQSTERNLSAEAPAAHALTKPILAVTYFWFEAGMGVGYENPDLGWTLFKLSPVLVGVVIVGYLYYLSRGARLL